MTNWLCFGPWGSFVTGYRKEARTTQLRKFDAMSHFFFSMSGAASICFAMNGTVYIWPVGFS